MEIWNGPVIFLVLLLTITVPLEATNHTDTKNETFNKLMSHKNDQSEELNSSLKSNTTIIPPKENNTLSNFLTKNWNTFSDAQKNNASSFVYTWDENNSKIDTEVPDLVKVPKKLFTDTVIENILLKDQFYYNVNNSENKINQLPPVGLVPGKLAAILAGVIVIISLIGYGIMLAWRRYNEKRYGNRQILADEDCCEKMDDFNHFTVSSSFDSRLDSVESQQMTLIKDKTKILCEES